MIECPVSKFGHCCFMCSCCDRTSNLNAPCSEIWWQTRLAVSFHRQCRRQTHPQSCAIVRGIQQHDIESVTWKKCKFALMWSISSGDQSESLNTASVLWFPWIVSLPKRPRRARARVQLSMFVFKPMLNWVLFPRIFSHDETHRLIHYMSPKNWSAHSSGCFFWWKGGMFGGIRGLGSLDCGLQSETQRDGKTPGRAWKSVTWLHFLHDAMHVIEWFGEQYTTWDPN